MVLVVSLLLIGALLLLSETVLPGLVAGVIGFLCVVSAVILGYVHFGPETGTFILIGVMIGLAVGTYAWVKFFPSSRVARMFISTGTIGTVGAEKPELLNQTGTAYTQLRPSGVAVINGKRVDVVSEGGLIEKGTPVRVIAIEGMRVVVRAIPS